MDAYNISFATKRLLFNIHGACLPGCFLCEVLAPAITCPFLDLGGFRWLRRVFEAAPLSCEKVLILRDASRYTVELRY
jgi:hypothetical protein